MKRIYTLIKITTIALSTLYIVGCNSVFKRPDTSDIDINIAVRPFYKDLFKPYTDIQTHIDKLYIDYDSAFMKMYAYELRLGSPSDSGFAANLKQFLDIKENAEVIAKCDSVWETLSKLNSQLTDAMKCIKYYFPQTNTPEVLTHFSGFNNNIIVDSTHISFSLEHYLGANCQYYTWLEIPQYAHKTKTAEYIVPDLVRAWIYANMPDTSDKEDILTAMIYQGKVLYATKKCLPDVPMHTIMGYDKEQFEWCEKAEANMWGFMAEEKLLYSTNHLDHKKLIKDAPFTSFFGKQSPGKAALYCGLNIVKNYIQKHPELTLTQLFANDNAQQILIESQYQP